jgi:hypothetical protein
MYIVYDTFNKKVLSRHRKIENAARSANKHLRAVRRINGPSSYIPTSLFMDSFDAYGDPKKPHPHDREYFDQCRSMLR